MIVTDSDWGVQYFNELRKEYLKLPKWKRLFFHEHGVFSVRTPGQFDLVVESRALYLLGAERGKARRYMKLLFQKFCEEGLLEQVLAEGRPVVRWEGSRPMWAFRPTAVAKDLVKDMPPLVP